MDQYEILTRVGLALAIGFLIGLERGWQVREEAEGERTAGLRTFTLIALSGGIWGLLAVGPLGPVPLAAAFLAVAGAMTLFRWRETQREGRFGATTVIVSFLTFALGAYAVVGDKAVAAAAAVATAALLAAKGWLHAWMKTLSWEELRATLTLLVMSFIALPLLPDRGFGPYEAFNPYNLWLMTIAIAGVSFIGYVAVKTGGARYGALIGGLAGGLVSSTATTVDFARRARTAPAATGVALAGAFAASAIMFIRVGVVLAAFGPALFPRLAIPLAAAAVVLLGAALLLARPWAPAKKGTEKAIEVKNPFDLKVVIGFAALLALILFLSKALLDAVGSSGAIALGAVAGLADVDAITLSMTQVGATATPLEAEIVILVAVAANSVSKAILAFTLGNARFGVGYGGVTAVALAAGAVGAVLTATTT